MSSSLIIYKEKVEAKLTGVNQVLKGMLVLVLVQGIMPELILKSTKCTKIISTANPNWFGIKA